MLMPKYKKYNSALPNWGINMPLLMLWKATVVCIKIRLESKLPTVTF